MTSEPIDPRLMSDDELAAYAKAALEVDRYDWVQHARPDQLEPESYRTFLYSAGRGAGKTRAAAEIVRKWCETPNQRIAVVALGHRELRDVTFDQNVSGLLYCIPPDLIASVKLGLGDVSITLKNGSVITGMTAGNAEAIRGRSFHACWLDEYAAWNRNVAQDVVDQLWLTMRESANPRMVITTTPRRVPHVVDIYKRFNEGEAGVVVRMGRTRDNTHLSDIALEQLERMYGGTRLGRQELDGELLLDIEGALWNDAMLAAVRLPYDADEPVLLGTLVGVDPSGSEAGDECGVVVVGWDRKNILYVVDNKTRGGTPAERYSAACMAAYEHKSRQIWYENAYGGDNIRMALESQWKVLVEGGYIPATHPMPQLLSSTLTGSKVGRAEPLVSLYEAHQVNLDMNGPGRIWHLQPTVSNGLAKMENELISWQPHSRISPNALDALVHAARQVMRTLGLEVSVSSPNQTRRLALGWRP